MISRLLWTILGKGRLKKLLDKLPANGKKTVIGVVLMALAVAAEMFPQYSGLAGSIIEFIKDNFESSPLFSSGALITIVGVYHKIEKILDVLVKYTKGEQGRGDSEK